MKRSTDIVRPLLTLLLIIVVVATVGLVGHLKQHTSRYAVRQACDILTPAIARSVAGNSLAPQTIQNATTDTTTTTYCVYRGADSSVALIVRSAKNQAGVELNKAAFSKPLGGSRTVHGYGDAAYWSPQFAQFNILENNTWYIVSNGPNLAAQRTLKDSEQLANKISAEL